MHRSCPSIGRVSIDAAVGFFRLINVLEATKHLTWCYSASNTKAELTNSSPKHKDMLLNYVMDECCPTGGEWMLSMSYSDGCSSTVCSRYCGHRRLKWGLGSIPLAISYRYDVPLGTHCSTKQREERQVDALLLALCSCG